MVKKVIKKLVPSFLLSWYHYTWALLSVIVFWFPSKKLTVIGVTGTSGKSTTVDFITRILEEAGHKVASTSSIRFKVAGKEWKNTLKMTMPGRFVIQKILKQATQSGCKYAVLEVTSEGIKQFRHKFIDFNTAVFTNLSPEHIESHGGFENYRNEKLKLFKATKNLHIINADDQNAKYFIDIAAKNKLLYGVKNQTAGIRADEINTSNGALNFEVNGVKFNLNLMGNFNILNALAAISVGVSQNISLDICEKALSKVKVMPGRLEVVAKDPFWVVVDYAFTPEQLEASYMSLNSMPLVCVLGSCGGGRDKWKRPVLGKIASKYCKEIIITNEDPYDEDPSQILSEIKSGISNSKFLISNFYEILNRREAIKKAVGLAKPGDAVIITGKGSESAMCVENGKKIPWDDRQIAKEALIGLKIDKVT